MKSFVLLSALSALGAVSASPTKSLNEPPTKRATTPQISASGNAFWKDGKRFYIRGIDYQPGGDAAGIDPLADKEICERDIKKFKDLGVNTIRVYTVDNTADHKDCMAALADAGIYLVVDVNTSKYSINRADAASAYLSYNAAYLQNVFATVSEFAQYDNTFAFFSGNEVINKVGNEFNAPYIKAITRDIKAYMKAQKIRAVPVGYSAADVSENRLETAQYMNCGPDSARSDFFAFNDYSWCNTDFTKSGWDQKVKNFTDYGLPLFLSEYGCNENGARKFDEVSALMSDEMTGVYSGGLMYEYSYEESKYGIVDLDGKNGAGDVSERKPEYGNFKSALKDNPAPTGDGGAAKATHSVECPSKSGNWDVDPSLLPVMPKEAEQYITGGAGKGAGLTGKGSQTAGDSGLSTKNATADGSSGSGNSTGDGDSAGVALQGSMLATAVTVLVTILGTTLL